MKGPFSILASLLQRISYTKISYTTSDRLMRELVYLHDMVTTDFRLRFPNYLWLKSLNPPPPICCWVGK